MHIFSIIIRLAFRRIMTYTYKSNTRSLSAAGIFEGFDTYDGVKSADYGKINNFMAITAAVPLRTDDL